MKTKLRLTAAVTVLFMGSISFGQSLNANFGYSFSKIKFDGMETYETSEIYNGTTYTSTDRYASTGGLTASLGYEFKLGNRLSLETGLKYLSRGYRNISHFRAENGADYYEENYESRFKINYIDVPVVLNTAILVGDVRVYARTGIYAGFLLGMKGESTETYSSSDGDSGNSEYSYSENGSDFDFEDRVTGGLLFGAGVEYKGFYFETNYALGVLSLSNWDDDVTTNDISVTLGYKLKFNK
jgi:hypothetical protein